MIENIDPGELRTLVAYEARTDAGKGAAGTPKPVYVERWRNRVAIRPLSSRELAVAAGTASTATHRVTIRWRPGVLLKDRFRVVGTSRVLEITSALNLEDRDVWLVCQAEEKTG